MTDRGLERFRLEARESVPELAKQALKAGLSEQLLTMSVHSVCSSTDVVIHERFWLRHGQRVRGFIRDMPIVCDRFRVVFPAASSDSYCLWGFAS